MFNVVWPVTRDFLRLPLVLMLGEAAVVVEQADTDR